MQTTYTYKEQTYSNLYELSEALGKDGVFIPLSIGDEALAELGVTVVYEEEPIENVKQRKILMLNTMATSMITMRRRGTESMQLLSLYLCKARAQALIGLRQITKMLK